MVGYIIGKRSGLKTDRNQNEKENKRISGVYYIKTTALGELYLFAGSFGNPRPVESPLGRLGCRSIQKGTVRDGKKWNVKSESG
jgi:hypothetical protein